MSDQGDPPSLDDLDRRLKAAHDRRDGAAPRDRKTGDVGAAIRVSVDLLAGIGVGALIGWGVDFFAGTGPWGLVVGFVLGSAAGINNVMRTARRLDAAARHARDGGGAKG